LPDRLPQAPPFRFVDRVLEIDPPRRCVTLKIFSAGEVLLEGAVADGKPVARLTVLIGKG